MKIKKLLVFSSLFSITLLLSNPAFADFDVVGANTKPCDLDETKLEYFGNAHTPSFRTAITQGRDESEIPMDEQMEIAEKIPSIEYDSFYVRIRGHLSKRRFSKVKNASSTLVVGTSTNYGGLALSESSKEDHVKGVDFALGYVWPTWRADLEYIFLKTLYYNPNPLFANANAVPATGFSASIKTDALLANFYYEFLQHDRLRPYAFFGLGLAMNKASTEYNSHNRSVQYLSMAWAFGGGFKFRIIDRLYFDAAFRYAQLGTTKMFNDNALHLKGKNSLTGVCAGLLFLI